MDFVPDFAADQPVQAHAHGFVVRERVDAVDAPGGPALQPQILRITHVATQEPGCMGLASALVNAGFDLHWKTADIFIVGGQFLVKAFRLRSLRPSFAAISLKVSFLTIASSK